jgi:putative ATP-dependent endonuclease of the OLD family
MKISDISIRRFRAFDQKVSIPLSDLTVLTGPNNLGKSTVLSALSILFGWTRRSTLRTSYDYDQDYPKKYMGVSGRRWPTRIECNLDITDSEKLKAKDEIGLELPLTLSLSVEMKFEEVINAFRPIYKVEQFENERESSIVAKWINNQIRYVYIPATRNVDDFRKSIFTQLVDGAVQKVSHSKRRINIIEAFHKDVRSQIADVENTLAQELRAFIPSVGSVSFEIAELELDQLVSVKDVQIDDGVLTSLKQKGDGFKSLFVISMLQFIARQTYGQNLIFGIEEPEAHLHSTAIYEVKETLRKLSESYQTIITTHSPILIQRDNLSSNIIIELASEDKFASSAKPAQKLSEIQQSLGIRPQDNMTTAVVIVVVEGLTEENCFGHLVSAAYPDLRSAISTGMVRFLSSSGASNMLAVVRALARDAANCIVLLDSDEEGIKAQKAIASSGLIEPADLFSVPPREGCLETEFEDLFPPEIYLEDISALCGVSINPEMLQKARVTSGNKKTKMQKWSSVMKKLFASCGKDWSQFADSAKEEFGKAIVKNIDFINVDEMAWLKSISAKIQSYLS